MSAWGWRHVGLGSKLGFEAQAPVPFARFSAALRVGWKWRRKPLKKRNPRLKMAPATLPPVALDSQRFPLADRLVFQRQPPGASADPPALALALKPDEMVGGAI